MRLLKDRQILNNIVISNFYTNQVLEVVTSIKKVVTNTSLKKKLINLILEYFEFPKISLKNTDLVFFFLSQKYTFKYLTFKNMISRQQ